MARPRQVGGPGGLVHAHSTTGACGHGLMTSSTCSRASATRAAPCPLDEKVTDLNIYVVDLFIQVLLLWLIFIQILIDNIKQKIRKYS